MIMEGLSAYGTPWNSSGWIKITILGAIFGRFFGHFNTLFRAFVARKGMMWRCFCLPDPPRIVDWCFTKEIWWLSRYLKPQVLQNIANHDRLRAVTSSSEMAIYSPIMDRFGRKRARCWPADSILRPTILCWVHRMRMEGLSTCGTPFLSPDKLNNTVRSRLGPSFTGGQTDQRQECWPLSGTC